MVNYENGKIYKITGTDNDGNLLIYIGSTTLTLCQRLAEHISNYKAFKKGTKRYVSSYLILDLDDCLITLVELCPCSCREELLMIERKHYDNYDCVNLVKPYVSEEEFKKHHNEWRLKNADRIRLQLQNYYIEHIDELKAKSKIYRSNNKDKLKEKYTIYIANNKEHKKEYDKIYSMKNSEKKKEKSSEYYHQNKDEINKKRREKTLQKRLEKQNI